MNDPQDLLYTNSFVNTDILTEKEINEQTTNYDRFINYESNQNTEETNNTLKYINNDNEETDPINIQKSVYQPFPVDNNKNNYPLFDPLLRDLSKNTYTKIRDTIINIDASSRNPILYPLSSKFKVDLPRTINNIQHIEISNINIPNFLKSVTSIRNNFSWQYFNDYYIYTDTSYNIIPFQDIFNRRYYSYLDIPFSSYIMTKNIVENDKTYDPNNFLTYQVNIQEGNYTIDELVEEIETSSSKILHGVDKSVYLQKKPENIYNICEEPYFSFPNLKGSGHNWKFEFNKQSGSVFCTNRMEEIQIMSIQTFFNSGKNLSHKYFKQNDIFYNYSSLGANYSLDPKYIYITLPLIQGVTDQWFDNSDQANNKNLYPDKNYENLFKIAPFPLVISYESVDKNNKPELFNFVSQFTMTTFWDLRIYTVTPFSYFTNLYTEDEMFNISYYKFSDIISIPNSNINLIRLALRWSPASSKGVPVQNAIPKPDYGYFNSVNNITEIFNKSLLDIINNNSNIKNLYNLNSLKLKIGRSLPCRLIYGKDNNKFQHYKSENINETKKSILEYFNFSIANSNNGDIKNIVNRGFAFIHSNVYGSTLDQNNIISQFVDSLTMINTKNVDLGLKIVNNNFYLKNNNYVYLKILFDGIDLSKIRQNQNEIALSETQKHINQNYSNSNLINYLGIGESANCFPGILEIQTKNYDGIFCKIFTSTIPGDINVLDNNLSSKIIFSAYENLLTDVTNIKIEILDSDLKIINTSENYSFDLKFIYSDSKLKETNINTKTNKIDLVGKNY